MESRSRRFLAPETVDSELVYLYLFLFLCLGFLSQPADYGHTYQREDYRSALDLEQGPSEILATANPGEIYWDQMESEVIAIANSTSFNCVDDHGLEHLKLDSSGGLRCLSLNKFSGPVELLGVAAIDINLTRDVGDRIEQPVRESSFEREKWTLSELYLGSGNVLLDFDPRRRLWFLDGGTEQSEVVIVCKLVIDNKIPKGTSTESSLNLPSSAICLDSIPKSLLTLLRDETIEILGKIKNLCHADECSSDNGVEYLDIELSPDNDFELRVEVIPIILAGIIIFVGIFIISRKRIRSRELDALVLEESDLDESCLDDQILYENLLREAVLISSKGSSGQVFKVRFLGLECAMKVFHSNARMDFRKESLALLNLSHPHVVKLFCIFTKPFIIMELMDEDLFSFITKIRERRIDYDMPLEVAVDVMLQIAEGMSYLHEQGLAHQDLKSLNILLKLRGDFDAPDFQIIAKIADLGSARRFNPRYPKGFVLVPNMNIGTRSWRAPELFHPRGSSWTSFFCENPRVLPKPLDIYGFAVICSELVTKQIPFSTGQDLRVAVFGSKVREGHRPALPSSGCPEGLLALIKDCWHGDPVLRPEFHDVCTRLTEVRSWMTRGQSSQS